MLRLLLLAASAAAQIIQFNGADTCVLTNSGVVCPGIPPESATTLIDNGLQAVPGNQKTYTVTQLTATAPGNLDFALSANPVYAGGSCAATDATTTVTNVAPTAVANTVPPQFSYTVPFQASAAAPNNLVWGSVERELQAAANGPYLLCWRTNGGAAFSPTGFYIKPVWLCNSDVATPCADLPGNAAAVPAGQAALNPYRSLTVEQRLARGAQTTCCTQDAQRLLQDGTTRPVGQCINPNLQTCCNGGAVTGNGVLQRSGAETLVRERCCNAANQWIRNVDQACPCTRERAFTAPLDCPTGETCCLPTKYDEFLPNMQAAGECYNPATHQCCDTGLRYDPGVSQCCVVNGIQTLDDACPCASDAQCRPTEIVDQTVVPPTTRLRPATAEFLCCQQTNPTPREFGADWVPGPSGEPGNAAANLNNAGRACTQYSNWPTGTGVLAAQRCLGRCFDPRFQTCCNGATCVSRYEKCCNATCCNRFTGTCERAFRSGSAGNQHNSRDFRVEFETCTTIEQIDPIKAFLIFVLPTALLLATLGALALVLVFANKASVRRYHFIEKALIAVAVLLLLVALPRYFSPAYKYGLWVALVAVFTIATAAGRYKLMNILAVIFLLITLLYLFDFFTGSEFFTTSSWRLGSGRINPESAGVWHWTNYQWRSLFQQRPVPQRTTTESFCTLFYNYFLFDSNLADNERLANPEVPTFGYCSRGWTFALLMFEGFVILFALLLFVLALIALILRFKENYDPIELEVRAEGSVYSGSSYYGY